MRNHLRFIRFAQNVTENEGKMTQAPTDKLDENSDAVPPGTPNSGENICRACAGTGKVNDSECSDCGGSGKVTTPIGGAG